MLNKKYIMEILLGFGVGDLAVGVRTAQITRFFLILQNQKTGPLR
jgi:hypothetical protein